MSNRLRILIGLVALLLLPEQAPMYAAVVNAVNVPIWFYGLCLDQDDNPLEGVSITMRIRQWRGNSRLDLTGESLRFPRATDKQGRFELTGVKGDVATVERASLPGYEWMKKSDSSVDFHSGQDSLPTITVPVILRFWKKRGAEPMFVTKPSMLQRISPAGEPITIDLKTGVKVSQSENPLVRFALKRNPETLPSVNGGRKVRRGHGCDRAVQKCSAFINHEACIALWKTGPTYGNGWLGAR